MSIGSPPFKQVHVDQAIRPTPNLTAATIPPQDMGRITLTVLFIGGLLVVSFWIMRPFLPAILWATTLVLATWPLLLGVQRRVGNRRGIAVLVMTLLVLLVLILPLWAAVSMLVTNIDVIGDM